MTACWLLIFIYTLCMEVIHKVRNNYRGTIKRVNTMMEKSRCGIIKEMDMMRKNGST